jgi:hypothetical protein
MKFRSTDLWLPPLLAAAFLLLGLLIAEHSAAAARPETLGIKGWKALGYLVPYLVIFAVEPMERQWGRLCRRRRPL